MEPIMGASCRIAEGESERPGGERLGRYIDILLAVSALIFLAPLLILVAAIAFTLDPGPIFFGHRRLGRAGQTFRCWKFRTMVVDADARLAKLLAESPAARLEWARDHKLHADPRITPIGIFSGVPALMSFHNYSMYSWGT
jgi:exopolysaccharide production protein ExoY